MKYTQPHNDTMAMTLKGNGESVMAVAIIGAPAETVVEMTAEMVATMLRTAARMVAVEMMPRY